MDMDKKQHWENVFATKQQKEVGWYKSGLKISIDFFESQNVSLQANVIDVGSGDSYFVDYLISKKYKNIYALDISENALERLKKRIGTEANNVHFIVSDIIDFTPAIKYDYWHDRAVFHFLTEKNDIDKYIELVNRSINIGGKMMIATFSKTGPLKCSGLNISQYNKKDLEKIFSEKFKCIEFKSIVHETPFGTTQNFTFCLFEKIND